MALPLCDLMATQSLHLWLTGFVKQMSIKLYLVWTYFVTTDSGNASESGDHVS
jgi:hypothetical protein